MKKVQKIDLIFRKLIVNLKEDYFLGVSVKKSRKAGVWDHRLYKFLQSPALISTK